MEQVESQLVVLWIQFLELTKWDEKHERAWFITCNTKGHPKDECPTFAQYMAIGEPNPLSGLVGYCEICKTWGHHLNDLPLL
jgi:hypothetical protein